MNMPTPEVFELTSPPMYRLLIAETPIGRAKTDNEAINAARNLIGQVPDADLIFAVFHKIARINQNARMSAAVELLDELIHN